MLLFANAVNTHITSQDGSTALSIAAQEGHEDVVDLLLEANFKADSELKDKVIFHTTNTLCISRGNCHAQLLVHAHTAVLAGTWKQG